MLSGASTSKIQDALTATNDDISNNFGAQMEWLKKHLELDFVQMAKDRDLLGLRAKTGSSLQIAFHSTDVNL